MVCCRTNEYHQYHKVYARYDYNLSLALFTMLSEGLIEELLAGMNEMNDFNCESPKSKARHKFDNNRMA